ncbi:hypothetical protein BT69DRAFT_1333473 [Atractiella rhizophila]|nr:hypothetical protein BT69DRAFT_1333473 [Atractiella rhizophila]
MAQYRNSFWNGQNDLSAYYGSMYRVKSSVDLVSLEHNWGSAYDGIKRVQASHDLKSLGFQVTTQTSLSRSSSSSTGWGDTTDDESSGSDDSDSDWESDDGDDEFARRFTSSSIGSAPSSIANTTGGNGNVIVSTSTVADGTETAPVLKNDKHLVLEDSDWEEELAVEISKQEK